MLPVWNSVLKIKPSNSRRSSASSAKSLGCKLPGFVYFKFFELFSLCLTYTYICWTGKFSSLYHTKLKVTNNCSTDMRLYVNATSSLSQETKHVPDVVLKGKCPFSQPSVCSELPFSQSCNYSILFNKYLCYAIIEMFLFPSGFRPVLDQKSPVIIYIKTFFLLYWHFPASFCPSASPIIPLYLIVFFAIYCTTWTNPSVLNTTLKDSNEWGMLPVQFSLV